MKQVTRKKKLALRTETIRTLQDAALAQAQGGMMALTRFCSDPDSDECSCGADNTCHTSLTMP